jgi:hypothetical protein
MTNEITAELLADAFVGLSKKASAARGKIIRLLDGDIDKCNALAIEHGLDHFSDYFHSGKVVASPKALASPTRMRANDDDAPKGSNPWKSDITDSKGRPDWSVANRLKQTEVVRNMGLEHASRLAESAGSFVGAPRPNAKSHLPRVGGDTRVNPEVGSGSVR